jgi:hypothetical protein
MCESGGSPIEKKGEKRREGSLSACGFWPPKEEENRAKEEQQEEACERGDLGRILNLAAGR